MELEFKQDFEQTRADWDRFWRGENRRPAIAVIAAKEGVAPAELPNQYRLAIEDFGPVIDEALNWAATHEFLGDAIPFYQVSFAADHLAALLGASIRHHPDSPKTKWVEPFVRDWDDEEIRFQPEGYWWERTVACIRAFRRQCDGRLIVVGPHLQGGLDCLSAIRGMQDLLFELVAAPEKVKRAIQSVNRAIDEVRAALDVELDSATYGTMNRFGMHSNGMIDIPQCDFSCMISPEMFAEFELPALTHETDGLDGSIYHLDGPDAIMHLEALCSVPSLDMIQWQPGAGRLDDDWTDLYRRIDALGKGQYRHGSGAAGKGTIRRLWGEYASRKIYFHLGGVSRAELADFLDELQTGR